MYNNNYNHCQASGAKTKDMTRNTCNCRTFEKRSNAVSCNDNNTDVNVEHEIVPIKNFGLHGYPLASVYAPLQDFSDIYDCETGFTKGTIFKSLDLPFDCRSIYGGASRG